MVGDGKFSHIKDYFTMLNEILNLKGHPNRITGSKVMAILLYGWASAVKGLHLLVPLSFLYICFTSYSNL